MSRSRVGLLSFVEAEQALKMKDEPRSKRPSDAVCEENCHALEKIVLQYRQVNRHQIADTVGISTGSVKTILHEHFTMTKVCARWVPRMLDQKMKGCRCETSNENLELIQLNWNLFMQRISWVMRPGYTTTTPRPNNKACSGSMPVLQAPTSARYRHQLVR